MRWSMAVVVLGVLAGCDPGPRIVLDLRTDYVAGVEFHAVEVIVDGAEPVVIPSTRTRAEYLAGARLTEVAVEPGTYPVDVRLVRGGQLVAERQLLVAVASPVVVTAVLTRSCRGVSCPDGGDPEATTCVGGRCVRPGCTPETPADCPDAQCAVAADCGVGLDCAAPRCEDGVCLVDDAGSCGAGEFCHPELGCGPAGGGDCPPFTQPIDGPEGPFCIDVYESGTMIWLDAMAYCESRGGSLCTQEQWVAACETAGDTVSGLIGGWEWTSLLVDDDSALKHGPSDCETTSPHVITMDEYEVRCCLPL